jgi:Cd2+/Zn2+-exporting ATPase
MGKTESAIEALVRLRPKTATVVRGNATENVPIEALRNGDTIAVAPFEQVPIDCTVVSGHSSVDASAMTGESQPVAALAGAKLFGGTQNLDGSLVATVTAEAGATTLDRIVDLVREAQASQGRGERISSWFGSRYTVIVLAVFAVSFLVRLALGAQPQPALYSSLSLLVALSPCALVISVPATTLSALAWAARNGMLVRGGLFIEKAGKVDAVGLDKTGTLTVGRPELAELCVCGAVPAGAVGNAGAGHEACWHSGPFSDEAKRVLALAASIEQHAGHPLAEAIVRAAQRQGCRLEEPTDLRVVPGYGVEAVVGGQPLRIGQPRFFPDLPAEFASLADKMRQEGMTVAVMESPSGLAAFGLRDEIRPDASSTVERLRSIGAKPIALLTGDSPVTARAVAELVGVDEFEGGLLPEQKVEWVRRQQALGKSVLFVGDGVNDAPVIASAEVGIGMGGLGSDVALRAAGVVLMRDDLRLVPDLLRLGRKTNRTIAANLAFASGMVVALALMTFLIEAVWPAARAWTLPLAVVGHEGSTALVVLNGLRLLRGP